MFCFSFGEWEWLSGLWNLIKGWFGGGDISLKNQSNKRIVKAKKNSIAIGGDVTNSTVKNRTGENE